MRRRVRRGSPEFLSGDPSSPGALQDGPVILVGHSWAGMVISEARNDPKVAGLAYIARRIERALPPGKPRFTCGVRPRLRRL